MGATEEQKPATPPAAEPTPKADEQPKAMPIEAWNKLYAESKANERRIEELEAQLKAKSGSQATPAPSADAPPPRQAAAKPALSAEERIARMELKEQLQLKSLEQAGLVSEVLAANPNLSPHEAGQLAAARNPAAFGRQDPRAFQPSQGALPPGSAASRVPEPEPTTMDRVNEANAKGDWKRRNALARHGIRELVANQINSQLADANRRQ